MMCFFCVLGEIFFLPKCKQGKSDYLVLKFNFLRMMLQKTQYEQCLCVVSGIIDPFHDICGQMCKCSISAKTYGVLDPSRLVAFQKMFVHRVQSDDFCLTLSHP